MLSAQTEIHLMGTVINLKITHPKPTAILAVANERLRDYEKRFSANDAHSELRKIAKFAGVQPVKVDQELFTLIQIGKTHSLTPGSLLNIAISPLIQTWRIGFSDAKKPTALQITQALKIIDPKNIILDEDQQTVFLKETGMALDLGALAKGYFADRLLAYFKTAGVTSALIDLGGNVLTYGENSNQADGYWHVGLQHPFQPRGNFVSAVKIKNQSMVTSGIYERTNILAGHKYHHIFDQNTGYPIKTDVVSLTVISASSLDGEIYTTKLFGKKASVIIQTLNEIPGLAGIVITADGQLLYSKSLTGKIEFTT